MALYHDISCTLHAGPTTGWVSMREKGLAAWWQLEGDSAVQAAASIFCTKPREQMGSQVTSTGVQQRRGCQGQYIDALKKMEN